MSSKATSGTPGEPGRQPGHVQWLGFKDLLGARRGGSDMWHRFQRGDHLGKVTRRLWMRGRCALALTMRQSPHHRPAVQSLKRRSDALLPAAAGSNDCFAAGGTTKMHMLATGDMFLYQVLVLSKRRCLQSRWTVMRTSPVKHPIFTPRYLGKGRRTNKDLIGFGRWAAPHAQIR